MVSKTSTFLRLSANYTSLYIYLGIFTPFWGLWLRAKGITPSEIGLIIAVPYLLKIFVAPMISQFADKREEYWRPIMFTAISGFVFFTLYFFGQGFWQFMLITILVNLTFPAITPLLETITVSQAGKHNLDYGRIRSFGSFSFIAASVLFGWYLKENDTDDIIWAVYLSLILLVVTISLLPRGNKKKKTDTPLVANPIKSLLSDNDFLLFLLVVGLLQMSHGVYYSLGSLYWQEQGMGEDTIGILWGIGVIAEILFFVFCGKWVSNKPVMSIFALVGFLGAIRWAVVGMTMSLPILFVIQTIHALTYGASHLAAISYISRRVSADMAGSAQSLYSALPLGLGLGLATYIGGVLYEQSGSLSYYAMAVLCFMAFLIASFLFYRKK
ncbi:3-phenylpropionate MFS transporter [Pseudemcibacter aquimaris]|nr:3-phenylpropionate MFS transporter [Pseudemcibacter aquimaris]MCC3860646.1 3-phenylpropionate MFS transporter [Pseudemcibacter aquimaris]WDU59465.1 3-phenylpropionate MFS transporter [Pseudemcibacter aquimaris]